MEGSGFSFKFAGSLSIRCDKVMRQKVYKNAAINRKYIDDRRFQYAFELIQHHKEIKDHPERVSILNHCLIYTVGWA